MKSKFDFTLKKAVKLSAFLKNIHSVASHRKREMKKYLFILGISVSMIFFLPSCATILTRKEQSVKITSTPSGESVYVNGIYQGNTPLYIKLARTETPTSTTIKVGESIGRFYQNKENFIYTNTAWIYFTCGFGAFFLQDPWLFYTAGLGLLSIPLDKSLSKK